MKNLKIFKQINSTGFIVLLFLSASGVIYSQNINGKLGTGGQFIIRDTNNTFLTVSQSTGNLSLTRSMILPSTSAGSQLGTLFKGVNRFLHTYYGSGTDGFNTFLGINSGNFTMGGTSTQASYNTAVGYSSLISLTTGYDNSAFGVAPLYSNTTGFENSAFGSGSLFSNTGGSQNSAFGSFSLFSNTTGNVNSALGYQSLYSNTTGWYNSAFGNGSLYSSTTGWYNSAFGFNSLYSNTTGWYNSAFGVNSLYSNTTGSSNTALGYNAGSNITTGSNNIAIGFNAQVPTNTASNQVRIGNTSITYAGIQVAWTVTSDRNLKSNILPSPLGLSFIGKLNPVSYTRKNDEKGKTEYGLIAQEVEEVLKSEGIENAGLLTVTDEGEYQLRYNDLIAPMIKAIQELKEENDKMKEQNERKDAKITELEQQLNEMKDLKEKVTFLEKVMNELKENRNDVKEVKLGEK
ncbi:MAG: tail fiber domain-containing protein [Ignavibacteria bacterium]|nr:tail fiber domain-containing protein [Ignavibacteria bacterium]